jgi:long-chain acyl-CoA synthetase
MSVQQLLDRLAAQSPATPVLVGDEQSWNTPAICHAMDQLADKLAGRRVLAVLADNSPAWVMADLAALRESVCHVPLPGFFSDAQLAHVLDQTGADGLLTDQPARIAGLGLGFAAEGEWCSLQFMSRACQATVLPAGSAKVSFTSGSTGQPKGVCLSADGLLDTARAVVERLDACAIERHLAVLPLALLLENVAGVYASLLRGVTIHLPGLADIGWQGMAGFDPRALHQQAMSLRPSSLILVPELLKVWSLYLAASGQRGPESLQLVAVGGARLDSAALAQAHQHGLPACQGYGLTECGSVVSLNLTGTAQDAGGDVGLPLSHVKISVVDGEIHIASRAFLGYLHAGAGQPGTTFQTGEPFQTGDLGHIDARGHLHLSGRRKNLLITSFGRNISPEWVEAALLAQPAIRQVVVTGDGQPWLAAILAPMPGADQRALSAAVEAANRALPDYARVGAWIAVEAFTPGNGHLTGNGRPVRAAIVSHYSAPLAALYREKENLDVVL